MQVLEKGMHDAGGKMDSWSNQIRYANAGEKGMQVLEKGMQVLEKGMQMLEKGMCMMPSWTRQVRCA